MKLWTWALPGFFFLLGLAFLALSAADRLLETDSRNLLPDEVALTFGIIGISFVGTALLVGGIFGLIARAASRARHLQRTGKRGTAVVLDVDDTGVTVNNNPRVRLKLRVQPEDGSEFEVETKKVVSRLTIPQPGMLLAVRYDPENPKNLVFDDADGDGREAGMPASDQVEAMVRQALAAKRITGARQDEAVRDALAQLERGNHSIDLRHYTRGDRGGEPANETVDPLDRLKKLAELRDSGVLTESEFEVQKAKILAGL